MENCAFVGVNQSLKGNDVESSRCVTYGLDSYRSGQTLMLVSCGDGNETSVFLNVSVVFE